VDEESAPAGAPAGPAVAAGAPGAANAAVPATVEAAWARCEEAWDDEARHDALLGLIVQHDCFAWAAARYRARGEDAVATARLDRLRRAATAKLFATASRRAPKDQTPYRGTITVLVVLVIAAILGLVYALIVHDARPPVPTVRPATR